MNLTSFTDYGLRMLMRLASAPDQAQSTADLAEEFKLSRNHLAKIMQRLARGGIVETRRGVNGGAVLRRSPAEIRLGDVVRLLEQGQSLVECFGPGGGNCTIDGCCRLKSRLRQAEIRFIEDLNRSTLADIALPERTLVL
ncbi:MAG: Rrf2 family transcriptional regulator [Defluviimonas sp.]|nr:Rrf2 family transcriptional regulator [Defluviimonas sp.]